jgi:hypothetical protein
MDLLMLVSTVNAVSTPTYVESAQQRNAGGSGTGTIKQSTSASSPTTSSPLSMGVCWAQLGYVLDLNLTGPAGASPEPCKVGTSGFCAARFHPTKQSGAMGPVKGEVSADDLCAYVNAKYIPKAPHHATVASLEAAINSGSDSQ